MPEAQHPILIPDDPNERSALADRSAAILNGGGVLVLPTDTVYGICVRSAFPAAVERVYSLKRRPPEKPLPYLLPDTESVAGFVNDVPRIAARLMARWWPGPLTLVLGEPGVALRVPDHPFAREVLRRAEGPVMATSANLSGHPPAKTARDAALSLGHAVDLIVDGGNAPRGRASAVIRCSVKEPPQILRDEGLGEELLETMALRVGLVCTGNTCRSPMAAAILENVLARRLEVAPGDLPRRGVRVVSAGLAAFPGSSATPQAVAVSARRGLILEHHRSQALTPELMDELDLVFVMSQSHHEAFDPRPGVPPTVDLLDPDGSSVPDPFGGSEEVYDECFLALETLVARRLPYILARLPQASAHP